MNTSETVKKQTETLFKLYEALEKELERKEPMRPVNICAIAEAIESVKL